MPGSHPPATSQRRQFSILGLLILTSAVAVCIVLFREHPEVFGMGLLTCFWCWFLATLAKIRHPIWSAFAVGTIASTFIFFTSFPQIEEEFIFPVVCPMLLLNLWCFLVANRVEHSDQQHSNCNDRRKKAAARSLVFLALIPVCYIETTYRDQAFACGSGLLFAATVPWLVFWRRNRLAGFEFKKSWVDALSWRIGTVALWIAFVSVVPISIYYICEYCNIAFDEHAGGIQHRKMGNFILSWATLFFANFAALVLVAISVSIQWFRDRWWNRIIWMTLVYVTLVALGCIAINA